MAGYNGSDGPIGKWHRIYRGEHEGKEGPVVGIFFGIGNDKDEWLIEIEDGSVVRTKPNNTKFVSIDDYMNGTDSWKDKRLQKMRSFVVPGGNLRERLGFTYDKKFNFDLVRSLLKLIKLIDELDAIPKHSFAYVEKLEETIKANSAFMKKLISEKG